MQLVGAQIGKNIDLPQRGFGSLRGRIDHDTLLKY
jgi:hypothetical protein